MAKEKITVSIADIKMNLLTSSSDEVRRMATSLDTEVRKNMHNVGGRVDLALLITVMEQAESL